MLQKDKEHFYETVNGIFLLRDDIEQLMDILQRHELNIRFQDEDYFYENLDDLIKNKGVSPKRLKLEGRAREFRESVTVDFDKKSAAISCYGSKRMYTLGFEIRDYIKRKRRWWLKVFNTWLFLGAFITSISILIFADEENKSVHAGRVWTILSAAALLLISIVINSTTHGLNLVRRHEYGFWKRNRDKIFLAIIGVILGVVGTLIVQRLGGK